MFSRNNNTFICIFNFILKNESSLFFPFFFRPIWYRCCVMKIWTLNQREKNERYWWTEKKRSENSDTSIKVGYNILHYVFCDDCFKKNIFFTQVTVWRGDSTRKFSKKTSRKNLTYKTKIQKVMKNRNKNNSTQT